MVVKAITFFGSNMLELSSVRHAFCAAFEVGNRGCLSARHRELPKVFPGLPPTVANGTNRVGILLQNVGAVWGFHRHQVVDWRYVLWAAPAGGQLGVHLTVLKGHQWVKRVVTVVMILLAVKLLVMRV